MPSAKWFGLGDYPVGTTEKQRFLCEVIGNSVVFGVFGGVDVFGIAKRKMEG